MKFCITRAGQKTSAGLLQYIVSQIYQEIPDTTYTEVHGKRLTAFSMHWNKLGNYSNAQTCSRTQVK